MVSLEDYLSPTGITAFHMLLTSITMFVVFYVRLDFASVVIVICALVYPMGDNVQGILYGHLSFLNMSTLRWGMLPCLLFYSLSAIPYMVAGRSQAVPLEYYILLLILEGILYYAARQRLLGIMPSVWLAFILMCTYLHHGPYGWIQHMIAHPQQQYAAYFFRGFMEQALPLFTVFLLCVAFGTPKEEEEHTKKKEE